VPQSGFLRLSFFSLLSPRRVAGGAPHPLWFSRAPVLNCRLFLSSFRRVSSPLRPCNSPACFSDELGIHRRKRRCLHLITRQRQFPLAMLADSTFTVSLVTRISLCESNHLAPVCARPPWQVFLRCHKRLVRAGLIRRNSNYGSACISAKGLSRCHKSPLAFDATESENGPRNKAKFTFFIFSLFESHKFSAARKKISINGLPLATGTKTHPSNRV
jgi:hypothetical protein